MKPSSSSSLLLLELLLELLLLLSLELPLELSLLSLELPLELSLLSLELVLLLSLELLPRDESLLDDDDESLDDEDDESLDDEDDESLETDDTECTPGANGTTESKLFSDDDDELLLLDDDDDDDDELLLSLLLLLDDESELPPESTNGVAADGAEATDADELEPLARVLDADEPLEREPDDDDAPDDSEPDESPTLKGYSEPWYGSWSDDSEPDEAPTLNGYSEPWYGSWFGLAKSIKSSPPASVLLLLLPLLRELEPLLREPELSDCALLLPLDKLASPAVSATRLDVLLESLPNVLADLHHSLSSSEPGLHVHSGGTPPRHESMATNTMPARRERRAVHASWS